MAKREGWQYLLNNMGVSPYISLFFYKNNEREDCVAGNASLD
jgi:hypothetical protein